MNGIGEKGFSRQLKPSQFVIFLGCNAAMGVKDNVSFLTVCADDRVSVLLAHFGGARLGSKGGARVGSA